MNRYLIFSSMGLELVGLVIGSVYIGDLLDQKYQTKGLFIAGFCIASLICWLVQIVVLAKRAERSSLETDDN